MVRHPYKRDPKRDPNLENYPICRLLGFHPIPSFQSTSLKKATVLRPLPKETSQEGLRLPDSTSVGYIAGGILSFKLEAARDP